MIPDRARDFTGFLSTALFLLVGASLWVDGWTWGGPLLVLLGVYRGYHWLRHLGGTSSVSDE